MRRTILLRSLLLGAVMVLLTSAWYRLNTPAVMSETARAFLSSLTPEQLKKATFSVTDDERLNWHFIPRPRKGLPIKEMTQEQRHLASALLSAGLSQRGFIKATTIMSLEEVLRILELTRPSGNVRDPELYYFSIFGEPAEKGTWGWRVEGHHVALNFTIVNGKVTGSPNFFGANPRQILEGPRKGLRALPLEEDLARDLLLSLDANQRKIAVVSATAYKDILTGASRKAALEGQPSGLAAAKMNSKQREVLERLLEEYANNFPEQIAQARLDMIKKAGANLHFAWAGVADKGGPHYYRVQAPAFLVEYDCTQNEANHIHSVWRDFNGDFGMDMLAEHYKSSH
jgi:hypothetical protein